MPRVLIVEDDDSMRDMVGYALADEGMEIEAVADGESALEVFAGSGPFDLVIPLGKGGRSKSVRLDVLVPVHRVQRADERTRTAYSCSL